MASRQHYACCRKFWPPWAIASRCCLTVESAAAATSPRHCVWVLEPCWLDALTRTGSAPLVGRELRERSRSCARTSFGLSSCSAAPRRPNWTNPTSTFLLMGGLSDAGDDRGMQLGDSF